MTAQVLDGKAIAADVREAGKDPGWAPDRRPTAPAGSGGEPDRRKSGASGLCAQQAGGQCGDVYFDAVGQVADWTTPVPGGVGPMTVATLAQNTLQAAELHDAI
jgi:hypothetical protein